MTHRWPKRLLLGVCAGAAMLLSACTSAPPVPEWQANAFAALQGFSSAYLSGNMQLADFEFVRARSEIARTGRADLLAHAELVRCATRAASLEFDDCAGYLPLTQDATISDQAYAAYVNGRWAGLDAAQLPAQHRAVVQATGQGANVLLAIEDPLSRLVAAGALLKAQRLAATDAAMATETASAQGWRRPLLAWLGVQLQMANAAGDAQTAAHIQRRMELVASK